MYLLRDVSIRYPSHGISHEPVASEMEYNLTWLWGNIRPNKTLQCVTVDIISCFHSFVVLNYATNEWNGTSVASRVGPISPSRWEQLLAAIIFKFRFVCWRHSELPRYFIIYQAIKRFFVALGSGTKEKRRDSTRRAVFTKRSCFLFVLVSLLLFCSSRVCVSNCVPSQLALRYKHGAGAPNGRSVLFWLAAL